MNYFGLTANLIDAIFMIFGKTAKFLNARKIRWCFIIDIGCLSYWIYMDIMRGLYSQAFSALISIAICTYGFINWGKKNEKRPTDSQATEEA